LESILNNWTTLFLTQHKISEKNALFGLTLYVAGMAAMRLLIGSVFRGLSFVKLVTVSMMIIFVGILFINLGQSFYFSITGLILLGIGLAAGFPIILALAGEKYSSQSGTAFSIIFTIALIGNILINWIMGLIAKNYGIHHYTTVIFVEFAFMLIFSFLIFRKKNKIKTHVGQSMVEQSAGHIG
jgi:MFS family permease